MKLKKILSSNFAKSVAFITGGTVIAQILGALFSPIITRIYTPEEYGILTVYTAVLGLIAVIGTLKYEMAIPICKDDERAVNVMTLSFIVLIIFSLSVTLLLFFWGEFFLSLLDAKILFDYRYLIPFGVFFIGSYNIFMQWAFRKKNFKAIARTKLSQSIVGNGTKIGLGLLGIGPIGLLLGQILKDGAGITTLSRSFVKEDKHLLKNIHKDDIIHNAKRYKNFPIFYAPDQLLNVAGLQLPVFFLTSLYGNQIVGLYGLANGIVNLPMSLIGNSIGDVFYGEVASIGRTNPYRIKELSLKLFKRLVIFGLIPLLALLFFGPFLFSFVFGSEWYEAGVYARILSFVVFARLIFTPISRVFTVYERQKTQLFLDLFRVILISLSFVIARFFSLNSYLYLILNSSSVILQYFIGFLLAQRILNQEIKKKEIEK